MNLITDPISREHRLPLLIETIRDQLGRREPHPALATGLCEGARVAMYRQIITRCKDGAGSVIAMVPDEKEGQKLAAQLRECGVRALYYPMRDFVFHQMTASRDFEHERLSVLAGILGLGGGCDMVIATPDAALQYTVPAEVLKRSVREIRAEDRCDPKELADFLSRVGYVREDLVDGPGQYSVRGGIMDIFPPLSSHPVRMEFFDDEIEQMGYFDVLSQRKIEQIDGFVITPAREILLTGDKRAQLITVIREQLKAAEKLRIRDLAQRQAETSTETGAVSAAPAIEPTAAKKKKGKKKETAEALSPFEQVSRYDAACKQLSGELEALTADTELGFLDKYISLIYPEHSCLLDYFGKNALVLQQQITAIADRVKVFTYHASESAAALLEDGLIPKGVAEYNKWDGDYRDFVGTHAGVIAELFAVSMQEQKLSGVFDFLTKQTVSYAENMELLLDELRDYRRAGYKVMLSCENESMAKNTHRLLADGEIPSLTFSAAAAGDSAEKAMEQGVVAIVHSCNLPGYELPNSRFACLSLWASEGRANGVRSYNKVKKKKKSAGERILSYNDLAVGDYVVHENHGIGRYLGLESITVDGGIKDFIKLQYDGTDMLYLPCNQLDKVSKYIGARAEDGSLKLSKMGGSDWKKVKTRAKSAAKDMAKELIQLYAQRLRKEGYAYGADDEMQREFETAFMYEETDGQLSAVDDIKRDMEQSHPMDRLLCGDVGFGKTEVAMRAAFKAAENNKQVAILVPTTILALQHYQTMLARMRGFPVQIDMLSRFRTAAQQKESLRKLRRGETDIIVGTHRLLSGDVEFKDLGLLIVDEEQRFGVAHKEKIKQRAENIDVLTLTATPIPRTLNMAMSGIRDMSILEEAPGDRLPVQTYVCEYDDLIIGEAIRKELRRGGQVLYLHNTVEDIDRAAARVAAMAPDAVIATAHGQMDKEAMSDIWQGMVEGNIDILVCTTIVETGVDLPNANTLIIEHADRMGLSQLHQIRGRVGRSSRRAYAYFTYTKGKVLTEVANKRLSAIRDYTEFGSGFKVALRDLEIRGAGNILGAEQHGHIESVGYDLYMKLLNEAILEEKGGRKAELPECTVSLDMDAYIPEGYVRSQNQRIDVYKKIALIENEEDLRDVTDELLDRYGEPPAATQNLLWVSLLRAVGASTGMARIENKGGSVLIYPRHMNIQIWTALAAENKGRLLMNLGAAPYISCRGKGGDPMRFAAEILARYREKMVEVL